MEKGQLLEAEIELNNHFIGYVLENCKSLKDLSLVTKSGTISLDDAGVKINEASKYLTVKETVHRFDPNANVPMVLVFKGKLYVIRYSDICLDSEFYIYKIDYVKDLKDAKDGN